MNRFSPADTRRWRGMLLAKGKEISVKLERVLAGQNVGLDGLGSLYGDEPAEPPEKRLRRFLDHVMGRLRGLDDPDFGRCAGCDVDLGHAELDQMPWADHCKKCFAEDR